MTKHFEIDTKTMQITEARNAATTQIRQSKRSYEQKPACNIDKKRATARTKMERSMLNITYHDRKTNTWVRAKTGVTDVIKTTRRMKWSWAGHISRLKDDRWTKRITTWKPYGRKRLRGRPAKRWRDDLDEYWNETTSQRSAQDRQTWKQHAEAFAQYWDNTADI